VNILLFAALATAYAAEPEIPANLLPSVECSDAWLIGNSPQPGTAMALSTVVGFGAGHFYSGNQTAGKLAASGQVGGLALAWLAYSHDQDTALSYNDRAAIWTGVAINGVARLVDIVLAPRSAHRETAQRIQTCAGV